MFVEGRGNLGRTDALTQTDLLVSHEFRLGGGDKRLRLEFNGLNIFNQQQVRHVFDNRESNRRQRPPARELGNRPDAHGPAGGLRLQRAAGRVAGRVEAGRNAGCWIPDPRYGQADIWNPGFDGRFTVRFLF